MNENGDTLIALLRSHEAVGGLLLVAARARVCQRRSKSRPLAPIEK